MHVIFRHLRFVRKLHVKRVYLCIATWLCVKHVASMIGFLCSRVILWLKLFFFQNSLLLTIYYENTDKFRLSWEANSIEACLPSHRMYSSSCHSLDLRWRQRRITHYFVIKGNLFWIYFVKCLECNQPDSPLWISPLWWKVPWVVMNFLLWKICGFRVYANCLLLFV